MGRLSQALAIVDDPFPDPPQGITWVDDAPTTRGFYWWSWDASKDQAAPYLLWVNPNGFIALYAKFVNDTAIPYKIWVPASTLKGSWSSEPITDAPPQKKPSKPMKDY